ncbi:MAG: glycoside hydrolase family 28 protein [Muribaculaceae bacterium]|nr:glycoside hydrolase family 28 protein [Muribaculaceae bacterium]
MKIRNFVALALLALIVSACKESDYNVMRFGAKGDGITDDAAAIQKAIDECSENGGGSVIFPSAKTFMSGPIHLRSNVNLHFSPNARLIANPDEGIYSESAFGDNRGEGMMWISGKDIENFSISGTGIIDGNGVAFMGEELDDSYELKPVTDFDPRPHLLTLVNARKVNISDVTICNSAYWTIHLVGCYDVAINHISLLNNLKIRNGDGIDVDHSRKVRITGCFIESGDDCICLKNRREYEEYGSCHDIVVTNCIMTSRSCAVKIGSENMDSIYRVLFDNCIITDSNRGIGIQNRDEGTVSDVTFSNMIVGCHLFSDVWWGKSEPIYVTSYPRAVGNHKDAGWRFPKGAKEGKCGEVSDIRFLNITCKTENGIFLGCDTPGKVNDLYFDNVILDLVKETDYEGGVYDKRPCVGEGFAQAPVYGILGENVSGITIGNFKVKDYGFPSDRYEGLFKWENCTDINLLK